MQTSADQSSSSRPTVANYAIQRLADLGIRHAFGVPGDFSFPIDDAILHCPTLAWVASSNELNAAYAADGYARAYGAAILTTTYGVGELSAINGVMGAKAERLAVFHLVGAPSSRLTRMQRPMHHTIGDGGLVGEYIPLSSAACCVSAVLSPDNAVLEMERVIKMALDNRRPAYILLPQDFAKMPIVDAPVQGVPLSEVPSQHTVQQELDAAVEAIMQKLRAAKSAVALPAFTLARYGIADKVATFLSLTNIPFATTTLDKTVLSEAHPNFVGMYKGLGSTGGARAVLNSADVVLDFGAVLFDDISTGFATTTLSKDRLITIAPDHVEVREKSGDVHPKTMSYSPIWMGDVIDVLIARAAELCHFTLPTDHCTPPLFPEIGFSDEAITFPSMSYRIQKMLHPDDSLFVETGTVSFFLAAMQLPQDVTFYNQTLYGSIGWATPAAFGYALAAPEKRVICVTGDGSHQMTAQEVGVVGRYAMKHPMIYIVVNNGLYGIEEFLEHNSMLEYNVIAPWQYSKVPEVMGCADWCVRRVESNGQLEAALRDARESLTPAYIEIVMNEEAALLSPMQSSLLQQAYQLKPPHLPVAN